MPDNAASPASPPGQLIGGRQFADNLPPRCPPTDACPSAGTFYATHRSSPADGNDFRTAAQRGVFVGGDECKRCGNSIMASIEDARQLCRAYPDVHVFVSEGTLVPTYGMMKQDGSKKHPSHYTLWRFAGVTMHSIFLRVI